MKPKRRRQVFLTASMIAGLPYTGLRDAILTHPTLPEGLVVLFSSVPAH